MRHIDIHVTGFNDAFASFPNTSKGQKEAEQFVQKEVDNYFKHPYFKFAAEIKKAKTLQGAHSNSQGRPYDQSSSIWQRHGRKADDLMWDREKYLQDTGIQQPEPLKIEIHND